MIERTSEAPHLRPGPRLRELWGYREILVNLVRKELKVKYTASFLGAVWSLLNPIVFLAVFSFVVVVLQNRVPDFPVFLLSGLLAWNLFSASLLSGSRAVTDACRRHCGFYLGSIGGPAARLAQDFIRKVDVLEYPELGMEAVWRIEVEDFPAFIVVDDKGNDFFARLGVTAKD